MLRSKLGDKVPGQKYNIIAFSIQDSTLKHRFSTKKKPPKLHLAQFLAAMCFLHLLFKNKDNSTSCHWFLPSFSSVSALRIPGLFELSN
jgi:hypothetical protein